jgi:hypothetical protein
MSYVYTCYVCALMLGNLLLLPPEQDVVRCSHRAMNVRWSWCGVIIGNGVAAGKPRVSSNIVGASRLASRRSVEGTAFPRALAMLGAKHTARAQPGFAPLPMAAG